MGSGKKKKIMTAQCTTLHVETLQGYNYVSFKKSNGSKIARYSSLGVKYCNFFLCDFQRTQLLP